MSYQAVIFDLGGVVMPSPMEAFRTYERRAGLPHRFISEVIVASGDTGGWSRLERGELSLVEFGGIFEQECASAGHEIDAAEVLRALHSGHEPRAAMLDAIGRIRDEGLKTAALTNNWAIDDPAHDDPAHDDPAHDDPAPDGGRPAMFTLFDIVIESSIEGLRKPDPRIYELACERLSIEPAAAVFLDDLGVNLKPARAMGMATIKVAEPDAALEELETLLGFSLRERPERPGAQRERER